MFHRFIQPLKSATQAVKAPAALPKTNLIKTDNAFYKHVLSKRDTLIATTIGHFPVVERKEQKQLSDQLPKASRVIIYGPSGCGKSYTLAAAAAESASKDNNIVVFVPNTIDYVTKSGAIAAAIDDSTDKLLHQNWDASIWLQSFYEINKGKLEIPIQGKYKFGINQEYLTNYTIDKLVNLGVSERRVASDSVRVILTELQQSKSHNLVVLVDGFNSLFHDHTNILDFNYNSVHPQQLSLVNYFTKFFTEPLPENTTVVGATSDGSGVFKQTLNAETREIIAKAQPLSASSSRTGNSKLKIPSFTSEEGEALANGLVEIGWLANKPSLRDMNNWQMMTDLNTRGFVKMISPL